MMNYRTGYVKRFPPLVGAGGGRGRHAGLDDDEEAGAKKKKEKEKEGGTLLSCISSFSFSL
jgi:hypothetical protein